MTLPQEVSYAEWRGCLSKQIFETREAAQRGIQRSSHQGDVQLTCYRCRFGRHFHLATKREKRKKHG